MASIQSRGKGWRAQIFRNGQRVNATFSTRAEAQAWAIQTESAIIGGARFSGVPLQKQGDLIEVLFRRYADEVSPTKRGRGWEQRRLKALCRDFPVFTGPIADLSPPALAIFRDQRLAAGLSPYSVNRELTLVSAVINTARKEWRISGIGENPVHAISRPTNPRPRKQRVSTEHRRMLFEALGWSEESIPSDAKQWTAYAFKLAIETAMRKGEILRIHWGDIHLDKRFIHLPKTKNGDERNVPLSTRAMGMIEMLQQGSPGKALIPVSMANIDKLFRIARYETGLRAVRFHDSRREAATVMSKRLSNVLELAAVTGHRSLQVLKGYYEPDPTDLADKLG